MIAGWQWIDVAVCCSKQARGRSTTDGPGHQQVLPTGHQWNDTPNWGDVCAITMWPKCPLSACRTSPVACGNLRMPDFWLGHLTCGAHRGTWQLLIVTQSCQATQATQAKNKDNRLACCANYFTIVMPHWLFRDDNCQLDLCLMSYEGLCDRNMTIFDAALCVASSLDWDEYLAATPS